jgi:hypothetical protein
LFINIFLLFSFSVQYRVLFDVHFFSSGNGVQKIKLVF